MSNYKEVEFKKPAGCLAEVEIVRQISPTQHNIAFIRAVISCGKSKRMCPLYNPVRFSVTHPDSMDKAVQLLPEAATQVVTKRCPEVIDT